MPDTLTRTPARLWLRGTGAPRGIPPDGIAGAGSKLCGAPTL